jgi:hypothetical protein
LYVSRFEGTDKAKMVETESKTGEGCAKISVDQGARRDRHEIVGTESFEGVVVGREDVES